MSTGLVTRVRFWLSSLLQISIRYQVTCDLSTEDVRRLEECRHVAERYAGGSSDVAIMRLALRVYSRIIYNDLPTLYAFDTGGERKTVELRADKAPTSQADLTVSQLQLSIGRKSRAAIKRLAVETGQDNCGVLRSSLATLHRAARGDYQSFQTRVAGGEYVEYDLIRLVLGSRSAKQ